MNRNHRKQIAIGYILFILLFSLFPFIPSVSALVWNPGVTFSCDNEYYSTTTPLTVDNISVDTHWVSVNGIGFNVTSTPTLYVNFSSIKSHPKSNTGWIINWTAQKTTKIMDAFYTINGFKPSYTYILYANITGNATSKTATASGAITVNQTISTRLYMIYDPGIPTTLYVNTTGSDIVGTGTFANPYATLQKAINRSTTSDTIYVCGGTYTPGICTKLNRSGTASQYYTITNYGPGTVIIDGKNTPHAGSTDSILGITTSSYSRVTGISFYNATKSAIHVYGVANHIRIDNCTIWNTSQRAIAVADPTAGLLLENVSVDDNDINFTDNNWHLTGGGEAISFSGTAVKNFRIHGNTINNTGYVGFTGTNIDAKNGANNGEISYNTINMSTNGGVGVYVDGYNYICHNITVFNNYLYGNNNGINIGAELAGAVRDIDVYNNIVWCKVNSVYPMLVSTNAANAIFKNLNIYSNTFYCSGTSAAIRNTQYRTRLSNLVIKNNIFWSNSYYQMQHTHLNVTDGVTTIANNVFWRNTGVLHNQWTATDDPVNGWGTSEVLLNPLFVSHTGNFYLNVTSPAIGAATGTLVPSFDYAGTVRPQAGTYDIGAYERIGGGLVPAAPTATTPGPASNAVDISPPVAALNITIEDLNADPMDFSFRSNHTGAWVTLSSSLAALNGTYQSLLPGFVSPGKKWWSINVTDGAYWTNKTFNFTFIVVTPPTSGITLSHVRANWTTSTSVNITWTKGANITNTHVYRSNVGYTIGTVLLGNPTGTYFNDTLLDPTIRYYYTLRPYNSVSLLFGNYHNVSLAETDNTSITTSSSALFKGWLGTDKSVKANYHYSSTPDFGSTTINITSLTDYYNGTAPYSHMGTYYNRYWFGQTFTTGADRRYLYNVSFYCNRGGTPTVLNVYLYSANITGLPTGAILATGTLDVSSVSLTGQWITISMPSYYLLSNTQYALICYVPGSSGAVLVFYADDTATLYTGGCLTGSADGGATFGNVTTEDALFRINGKIPYTYPLGGLITSNTTKTVTGLYNITQTNLLAGQLYYYYATANDTKGNMTKGNTMFSLTNPDAPVFLNIIPSFPNSSVKITWLTGAGANQTVIRRSNTAYPTTPSDGVLIYNGTGSSTWATNISFNATYYFTLFSYTSWFTLPNPAYLSRFSTGVHIPWGGITYIIRNESKPWQVINGTMLVTDNLGLYPVQFTNCYGYHSFNISQIPYGENTIFFISNTSYSSRQYPITIIPNIFYNFTFYLPPLHPPGWNITEPNTTGSYLLQVINEQNLPVQGAAVKLYRFMNYTATYNYIGGFISDGYGQGSIILFPYNLYMVKITKDGYQNLTDFWTPNIVEQGLYKTFKIYYKIPTNETTYDFMEQIHITATLDNTTGLLTVHYIDDMAMTQNLQIYVYDVTNGTLMHTSASILDNDVITSVTVNTTHDYEILYKMNHTYFDYRAGILYITGWHRTITTPGKFNLLFTINFGFNPFGWSNIITWFIIIGCFFSFERRDSYMAMFLAGFFILFLNYYIGFNTAMAFASGGIIPIIMIFFGILMLIRDRYRFGVDM